MSTAALCSLFGLAIIIEILAHHRWLMAGSARRAREQRSAPPPARWPRLAVLRPIRGLDTGAAANLDALFATDYPGPLELVFLLDDERDPSYPIVEAAIARHPERPARIALTGEPPRHRTGKIHKMIRGAELVDADVLAFSDSDTRPQPALLRELVALLWQDPRRGIAFAPTVAVADAPIAGDIGYELLLDAWYGAAVDRVAGPTGEVPFAMGNLMLIRATALDAIGTMRAAEGELVDDMFLGRRMTEFGYANAMGTTRLPVIVGGLTLGEFLRIFRKWLFFSQSGLPGAFKLAGWMRAVPGFAAWAVLIAGIALASPLGILAGTGALAAFVFTQVRLTAALGGNRVAPKHWWIAAAMPFLAAGVALSTKLNHEVGWRGRRYRLDRTGRLRAIA